MRMTETFLSSPSKIDNLTSAMAAAMSPSAKKPKLSAFASKTEAFDSVIPDDHPLKGYGPQLRESLTKVLMNPKSRGHSYSNIAMAVSNRILASPGKSGVSKITEAFEYKRRADSAFFEFGEDEDIRKPLGSVYDDWLKERRVTETPEAVSAFYMEQAKKEKDPEQKEAYINAAEKVMKTVNPIASPGSLALMTGIGAAHGAMVAGVPGAIVGAGSGVAMEVFGKPLAAMMHRTEWYNARYGPRTSTRPEATIEGYLVGAGLGAFVGKRAGLPGMIAGAALGTAGATQKGREILTEIVPYAVSGVAFDKAMINTFLVPRAMAKSIASMPEAANVIATGKVLKANRKIMQGDDYVSKFVNRLFNPTEDMRLGINPEITNAFNEIVSSVTGRAKVQKLVAGRLNKLVAEGAEDYSSVLANYHGPNTPKEFVRRGNEAINMVMGDEAALAEAMSHPKGIVYGAMRAAERMKAAAYMDSTLSGNLTIGEIVFKKTEQEINLASKAQAMQNRLAQRDVQKAMNKSNPVVAADDTATAVRQESELLVPKSHKVVSEKDLDPIDWRKMETEALGEGPKDMSISTAGQAKVVDGLAESTGKSSADVLSTISKTMKSYEAPDIRKVFQYSAKPTQMDNFIPIITRPESGMGEAVSITKKGKITPKTVDESVSSTKEEVTKVLDDVPDEWDDLIAEIESGKGKVGDKTRTGKAFEETIDTEIGAQKIEYAASKGTTTEEAREIAVSKANELAKVKAKEAADLKEIRKYEKMSADEIKDGVGETAKMFDEGKISAEEALDKTLKSTSAITDNPGSVGTKFANEASMQNWLAGFDPMIKHLRRIIGSKTFMAAFGVPAGMIAFFAGDDEAQAGMLNQFVKGIAKVKNVPEATKILLNAYKGANYITEATLKEGQMLMTKADFQVGLKGTKEGGAAKILSDLNAWTAPAPRNKYMKLRHRIMSPGMLFEETVQSGKNLMNNPGVFKASWQAAEYVNTIKANQIVDRIIGEAGIPSAKSYVRDSFKELLPLMEKQVDFEYRSLQVINREKEIKNVLSGEGKWKKVKPDVKESVLKVAQEELAEHQAKLAEMKDVIPEYHAKHAEISEPLAREHSAVRVALAVGDNAKFDKYPYLRNIPFTREEKIAVGRVKEQLLVYKNRLEDLGEKVIGEDYFPHIFHPDFKADKFVNVVGDPDKAQVYMKIFKRSFDSRPLMPDLETTLRTYTGDIERRIHQIGFWKKEGWNTVMEKTQHIPVINYAFKNLKEGMAPVEQNTLNKIAQKYVEFEAVHKLFMSPSASLKHFFKPVGDIAQRGLGETLEAVPESVKMMGLRLSQGNPKIAQKLSAMGITTKSAQNDLMLDYFKSIIPAYGARRYILDMGLAPMDEMFVRARGIWGKIQDVSGSGINFAELTDRGLSLVLGAQVAAKKGLTIEQALYGTFDMILKSNFLSRELNPSWLNRPAVRAMAMFQATPFKIMERRVVNFVRSGRVVKNLGKDIYNMTKADYKAGNFNNSRKILKDLRDIRSHVKQGEHSLKANMFVDAALRESDFFGMPAINTFARELLIIGASTYAVGQAGMNIKHHFFHIPFMKPGSTEFTTTFNPALSAILRGKEAWSQREEGDDEFLTTKIYQRWLGKGWMGMLPTPVQKAYRVTQNDIPAIYKDSPYKYLFAIPTTKESRK